MTAPPLTLTNFLLARVAEDEKVAREFVDEGPSQAWAATDMTGPQRDDEYAQLTIGAGRVLAVCEAQRRIIRRSQNSVVSSGRWNKDAIALLSASLRDLALPYADHPDYREEWRA